MIAYYALFCGLFVSRFFEGIDQLLYVFLLFPSSNLLSTRSSLVSILNLFRDKTSVSAQRNFFSHFRHFLLFYHQTLVWIGYLHEQSVFPNSSLDRAFTCESVFPNSSLNRAFTCESVFPNSSLDRAFTCESVFPNSSLDRAFTCAKCVCSLL